MEILIALLSLSYRGAGAGIGWHGALSLAGLILSCKCSLSVLPFNLFPFTALQPPPLRWPLDRRWAMGCDN